MEGDTRVDLCVCNSGDFSQQAKLLRSGPYARPEATSWGAAGALARIQSGWKVGLQHAGARAAQRRDTGETPKASHHHGVL